MPSMPKTLVRLALPKVTLCAVSSSNVKATLMALEESLAKIEFAEALLLTDSDASLLRAEASASIRIVQIEPIRSSQAYSDFILSNLADFIRTDHCLIVQWDGHVLDAARWRDEFLDYDYLGASWPQFGDTRAVGNGGFSLRSKRLLEACREEVFTQHHPEDIAICHTNREFLEQRGLNFAPVGVANQFAAERAGDPATSFGYHGVFLMPEVLGPDRFWDIYQELDDRATLTRDFGALIRVMLRSNKGIRRCLKMAADSMVGLLGRR